MSGWLINNLDALLKIEVECDTSPLNCVQKHEMNALVARRRHVRHE